ncbi:substrate-binding domain-containing protein [Limnofasciculus baicalensis]|uniref:Substrate-binding domain-containing protein n=1 Tax=Limnofasciculus baicalensis BBK-W-15 TaxID=2699891 RepID=A0AAE3KP43_9CYAN|nr:substrate-binding domain-containing protein [Limnofasciculus baicalensis]MCP2729313.1 substrate-binding domain-containing protein [Limnofasciculus baicalensis BBK-W-15]
MAKVVVLSLEEIDGGGVRVTLEMGGDNQPVTSSRIRGKLPPNSEVFLSYEEWQSHYRNLGTQLRFRKEYPTLGTCRLEVVLEDELTVIEDVKKNVKECQESFENLKLNLNNWLNSDGFSPIKWKLLSELNKQDEIRFIICTENHRLRKLPWDVWGFFEEFPQAVAAIGPLEHGSPISPTPKKQVKILAILGDSRGIDTKRDEELLKRLEVSAQASVRVLVEPKRHEFEALWQESWDILFFAGHSSTQTDGETGFIYINTQEKLSLKELKNTLKKAINNGLQLAIFNSCDGLGIAYELEQLNIPQSIVMREPVPDQFAQEFLRYFLEYFSQDTSLYLSVREAREKLQDLVNLDNIYPGASWLPVICQHPGTVPLRWRDFLVTDTIKSDPSATPAVESIQQPSLAENILGELRGNPTSVTSPPILFQNSETSTPPQPKPQSSWQKITIGVGIVISTIGISAIAWWWFKGSICSLTDIRTRFRTDIPEQQRFDYGGSTSWIPIAEPFHKTIAESFPNFDLQKPKYIGSVEGIQQVVKGSSAFGLSSTYPQPIDRENAQKQGFTLLEKAIGIDAISISVNFKLNIPGLTLAQLKGIYTGRITNWQEVGGPNLPIIPYSRSDEKGGTVLTFIDRVLGGEPLNSKVVKFVNSTTAGVDKLTNNLGGIYYASAAEIVSQCGIRPVAIQNEQGNFIPPYQGNLVPPESCPKQRNQVNREAFKNKNYPLTRNLYGIIKDFPGEDTPEEKAGRAYIELLLTGKGQAIVRDAGFAPVKYACSSR